MGEIFWKLTVEEVQELAEEEIGRRLSEDELRAASEMFSEGTHWAEVLSIAVDFAVNQ